MKRMPCNATLLVILLLCGICPVADAQTTQVRATVQDCNQRSCSYIYHIGRGVNVGRDQQGDYLIVTAGHVLRDALRVQVAMWEDGEYVWTDAKIGQWIVDHERGIDIGVVRFADEDELPCLNLSDAAVSGETAGDVQFLSQNKWRRARLRRGSGAYVGFNQEVIDGDSGGPVMFRGLVVGIVSNIGAGPGSGYTEFTESQQIRAFLRRHGYVIKPRVQASIPPMPPVENTKPPASPSQVAGSGCGNDCRCKSVVAENKSLKEQLANLESQRRKVEIRTYQGKRADANIIVKRDGGSLVEVLGPDGKVADSDTYAAGESIKFKVVEVKE